jgi:GT2 family glycosyltransferase
MSERKKNNFPGVSIIVPIYNGGRKILNCLNSLTQLDYPKYEIIVVDNASTDDMPKLIKMFPKEFKLIENKENLGCAKATNIGIKAAKYPLILTLDMDVILDCNCLKEMVKVLIADGEIGAVVPSIYNWTTEEQQGLGFMISGIIGRNTIIEPDIYKRLCLECGESYEKCDFNYLGGCGLIVNLPHVPGAVVLARKGIAIMDEDYFLYYGDAQYSLDIRKAGYVIRPAIDAIAWHDCNTAEGFTPFRLYHYIKSKQAYAMKNSNHQYLFWAYFVYCYTPVKLLSFLLKGRFDLIKAYVRAM